MKVNVTKPQLDVMMKKYLDDFLSDHDMFNMDTFIIIRDDLGEYGEYDDEVIIEFDSYDGRLYIRYDLLDNMTNWFPVSRGRAADFIKDWFEGVANVHVDYIDAKDNKDTTWLT
jgi:hypothetical protein